MLSGRACKQKGWVGGGARSLVAAHTHKHTHCCGKTQGLNMLHKMLTSLYSADGVFSLTGFKRKINDNNIE